MEKEKRTIRTQIIVQVGENSYTGLVRAVGAYLETKGLRVALPHVYPEDPLIIEVTEPIPPINY